MKLLILIPLVLLSACTCIDISVKDEISGTYCSTKDIKGLDIEYDGEKLKVKLNSAINEIDKTLGVVAQGLTKGLTGSGASSILREKQVLEALTN